MKRTVTLLLVILLVCVGILGCAKPSNGGNSAQPIEADAQGTQERTAKDTIVWGQAVDINSLDFHTGKQDPSCCVTYNVFDSLVQRDPSGEIKPMLATEWEWLDAESLQMKLREGVTFHDGEAFTAEDVKFTFDRALNHGIVKNNFSWYASTEIVDDYTIIIHTAGPYAATLNALSSQLSSIMPEHLVSADDEAMAKHPIGTGPYKFVEWKEYEYVKLEAYDEYWNGPAKTKYLEMRVIPEDSQRATMLETGEIDIAYHLVPSDARRFEGSSDIQILTGDSFKVFFYDINMKATNAPLLDKRVRQAMECAIDKDLLVEAIMYGYATPVGNILAPVVYGYDPDASANKYDLEKAKQLMADAGYADGFSVTILVPSDDTSREEATVVIQEMLSQINIDVKIEIMEDNVIWDSLVAGADYDMYNDYQINNIGDADFSIYSLASSESASNQARYYNDEIIAKLMTARAMGGDDAGRLALYREILNTMTDDTPRIPIWANQLIIGARKGVEGFVVSPTAVFRLENVVCYE